MDEFYRQVADLANRNQALNHGRRYTPDDLQAYLEDVDWYVALFRDRCLAAVLCVEGGELGLIVDPQKVHRVYRDAVRYLRGLPGPLHACVLRENRAICRLLEREGFHATEEDDRTITYRRPAWEPDEPTSPAS